MRCLLAPLLLVPFLLASTIHATPFSDTRHLATIAHRNANIIFGSLNGTILLNTSTMVAQLSTAITSAQSRLSSSSNTTHIDAGYINYLDNLHSMAEAVQSRGRLFHSEMNLPVYQSLQLLASTTHSYSTALARKQLVGQSSIIRSMTAGSDIINAQAAWVQNANYPGQKRALLKRQ